MNKQKQVRHFGLVALLAALLVGCGGHNASMVAVEDLREQQQPQRAPVYQSGTVYQAAPRQGAQATAPAQAPAYAPPPGSAASSKPRNTVAYATPAPGYEQSAQRSSSADSASSSAVPPPVAMAAPAAEPSPALLALLEKAEEQQRKGQTQQALSSLERAQRIAPREPIVYLQLSQVYRSLEDKPAATQMARKGLSLSAGDPDMQQAFNDLLTLIK